MQLTEARYGGQAVWLRADTGDHWIAADILEHDAYQLRRLLERYPHLAERELTVLDVGGHIGCFGVLALSLLKKARLVAFEPLPEAAAVYARNLREHLDAGRAFLFERAVSYRHPSLTLYASADPAVHTGNIVASAEAEVHPGFRPLGRVAPAVTLEQALAETGLSDTPLLLKLDCELGEWDILPGLSDGLGRRVELLMGEYHDPRWQRILEVAGPRFPHLYIATHLGRGCGNFWGLPRIDGEPDYFADRLSLCSFHGHVRSWVRSLEEELRQARGEEKSV